MFDKNLACEIKQVNVPVNMEKDLDGNRDNSPLV